LATVVLIAGHGRTGNDWAKVPTIVSNFARVCSYDRAGLGESEKTPKPQSVEEVVDDLHNLLNAAGETPPYMLVGHSMGGIYSRKFVTKFPHDVAALVLVDSSHEEQMWRLHEVDPKGPDPSKDPGGIFLGKPGQRLDWQTKLPLIVLAHGQPFPRTGGMTEEQSVAFDHIWRDLQEDLAKRSPKGEFRLAEHSGHFIQADQPGLVVQAIRDLVRTR
jgi:pimeloyl-ACP methyl ester carboxylesterase